MFLRLTPNEIDLYYYYVRLISIMKETHMTYIYGHHEKLWEAFIIQNDAIFNPKLKFTSKTTKICTQYIYVIKSSSNDEIKILLQT